MSVMMMLRRKGDLLLRRWDSCQAKTKEGKAQGNSVTRQTHLYCIVFKISSLRVTLIEASTSPYISSE